MAKKKDKPQVINNIQELNLEIDYDKLAEAIVKAQGQQERQQGVDLPNASDSRKGKMRAFWNIAKVVVLNREEEKYAFLSTSLAALIQLLFNFISFTLFCISVTSIGFCSRRIYDWIILAKLDVRQNIWFVFECLTIFLVSSLLSLIMRGIANEIGREKDKHYIISVFSGLISLVALIVAIIALSKGVR